ncbi:hypothetical protein ES703_115626 [subsurface metagenome]
MIKVYLLPIETIDGTEQVAGIDLIHDALLDTTEDPLIRKLIQDTTDQEHAQLATLSLEHRDATPEELALFEARELAPEPDADTLRAQELLATSPSVITQPEMWELMRIFGRRLGIPD